jgi:L-aspartate oxidase
MRIECDFLVIGSGIAGLTFARKAEKFGKVLVICKTSAEESSTERAQGGIATVLSLEDNFESHIKDTLNAGRGLCHLDAVEKCVEDGPARIRELMDLGVRFDERAGRPGELDLGREGGHSKRRIVHATDATGKEVMRALLEDVRRRGDIQILEHYMAVDVIVPHRGRPNGVCMGAYVLDVKTGEVHTILARATVLATGGAGKVYLYTSNPDVATGDGIAMAYRAGAEVADLEFFQFHPTILYHPQAKGQLISEAVRGEGAVLRNLEGVAFMQDVDKAADLAPRDVVARAIDDEMKRSGEDCVFLDATHLGASFLAERFPHISAACSKFGVDIAKSPIPVVPAAHYSCGGVKTDLFGRTNVAGLFAIGETACTGLHGANRLASNSLLEGLVFAHAAVEKAAEMEIPDFGEVSDWQVGAAVKSDEHVVVSQDWDEVRRYMWNYVGIVRSDRRLMRAKRRSELMLEEISEYYWKYHITSDLLELRNIAAVSDLVIQSAMMRKESRGLHFTSDYPKESTSPVDTVLCRFNLADSTGRKR